MSSEDKTPVEIPEFARGEVASCKRCIYYGALDKVCRRDAPKPYPIPNPQGVQIIAIWTPVDADRDWCGKFKPSSLD